MSLDLLLLLAGIVAFALALGLFRARRTVPAAARSIWQGGNLASRMALLLWWVSLALLVASAVVRLTA